MAAEKVPKNRTSCPLHRLSEPAVPEGFAPNENEASPLPDNLAGVNPLTPKSGVSIKKEQLL